MSNKFHIINNDDVIIDTIVSKNDISLFNYIFHRGRLLKRCVVFSEKGVIPTFCEVSYLDMY